MLTRLQLEPIVKAALMEDLAQGDVTTDFLPELKKPAQAVIRTRSKIVISGIEAAVLAFQLVDPEIHFKIIHPSGSRVSANSTLIQLSGCMASILKAERTALNFLQHLSGIATETRKYAEALEGIPAKVIDTRKTTPGLRLLEKQAVMDGGGSPHRYNLSSAVMLKDNHIQLFGSIQKAVENLRNRISHTQKIEVEADTLEQAQEAIEAGADIVLLDNMTPAQVAEIVAWNQGRAIMEASGGISLETIRAYGEAGAQYISTSKITLGAPVVDIGLDISS